jgi:hypothetical protein
VLVMIQQIKADVLFFSWAMLGENVSDNLAI